MGHADHVLIPRLEPTSDLRELAEIARTFIRAHGFDPTEYLDDRQAIAAVETQGDAGSYPLLLTPLDTSGEKPYEEFVGDGEIVDETSLGHLRAIRATLLDPALAAAAMDLFRRAVGDAGVAVTKGELVAVLSAVIPQFRHIETGRILDDRV